MPNKHKNKITKSQYLINYNPALIPAQDQEGRTDELTDLMNQHKMVRTKKKLPAVVCLRLN